jgi:hypothetical protein
MMRFLGLQNFQGQVPTAAIKAGTDGELITWDSSGLAGAVAVGTATHVLTSNGAGAAPTFQAAAGGVTQIVTSENLTAYSSTSTSFAASGVTITIADVVSGKTVIIEANVLLSSNTDDTVQSLELRRGTTSLLGSGMEFHAQEITHSDGGGVDNEGATIHVIATDAGHGGGSVVYNLYYKTNSGTAYIARNGDNENQASYMRVTELP